MRNLFLSILAIALFLFPSCLSLPDPGQPQNGDTAIDAALAEAVLSAVSDIPENLAEGEAIVLDEDVLDPIEEEDGAVPIESISASGWNEPIDKLGELEPASFVDSGSILHDSISSMSISSVSGSYDILDEYDNFLAEIGEAPTARDEPVDEHPAEIPPVAVEADIEETGADVVETNFAEDGKGAESEEIPDTGVTEQEESDSSELSPEETVEKKGFWDSVKGFFLDIASKLKGLF